MQLLTHYPPIIHPPAVGRGGGEMGKLVDWDKNTLIDKAKAAHKQSKTRNLFNTSYSQASVQPCPGKPGSIMLRVTCRDECHNSKYSFFPSFPSAFISEPNIIWSGISLWSSRISCSSCVLSKLLAHSHAPHWWGGKQKKPWHCKSCQQ